MAFDGEEVGITASQYDRLITHREDMLSEADLLVDKCAPGCVCQNQGALGTNQVSGQRRNARQVQRTLGAAMRVRAKSEASVRDDRPAPQARG